MGAATWGLEVRLQPPCFQYRHQTIMSLGSTWFRRMRIPSLPLNQATRQSALAHTSLKHSMAPRRHSTCEATDKDTSPATSALGRRRLAIYCRWEAVHLLVL